MCVCNPEFRTHDHTAGIQLLSDFNCTSALQALATREMYANRFVILSCGALLFV